MKKYIMLVIVAILGTFQAFSADAASNTFNINVICSQPFLFPEIARHKVGSIIADGETHLLDGSLSSMVFTLTADGQQDWKIQIDNWDKTQDLGGSESATLNVEWQLQDDNNAAFTEVEIITPTENNSLPYFLTRPKGENCLSTSKIKILPISASATVGAKQNLAVSDTEGGVVFNYMITVVSTN